MLRYYTLLTHAINMMGSDDSGYGSDSFVLKHDNIIYIKMRVIKNMKVERK
jgi:hypothetical protein